jgi:hypothetical protein
MKTKTAEDFQRQVKEHDIRSWTLRCCSICETALNFIFDGDDVYYDSNCNCVTFRTIPQERTYQDIADIYNKNIENEDFIEEINDFFEFKD